MKSRCAVLAVQNGEAAAKRCEDELRDFPGQMSVLRRRVGRKRLEEKQQEVGALGTALAEKRRQADGLDEVREQEAPLAKKVKDAEAELAQLEGEKEAMRQLGDNDGCEFTVLASAVPAETPALSTRKMVTAFAFAVPMLLFCGLLVGCERVKAAKDAGRLLGEVGPDRSHVPPAPTSSSPRCGRGGCTRIGTPSRGPGPP